MPVNPSLLAVAFDLDGLMFNTEELYQEVGAELLRRRGKEFVPELLHQMMGRPQAIALQMMIDWHSLSDTVEVLSAETKEVFVELLDHRLALMPGLAELLDALEFAEIPKAVVTSSGPKFTCDVLGRFNLESRFSFIVTCEDVQIGKPDPEIYLQAAARFGVAPQRMMALEDSANGCRAAVAAGSFAVAVPAEHSITHQFPGAALVAETLRDPRIYIALGIRTFSS
ncbi:MAG: HAD family phosphatase [Pirellulales bacterium]|nr:HAD family phosphatase [Pirellulales bacterium]